MLEILSAALTITILICMLFTFLYDYDINTRWDNKDKREQKKSMIVLSIAMKICFLLVLTKLLTDLI
jgi:hypothetical protein